MADGSKTTGCFQRADFIVWVKTFKITKKSLKTKICKTNSENSETFYNKTFQFYSLGRLELLELLELLEVLS